MVNNYVMCEGEFYDLYGSVRCGYQGVILFVCCTVYIYNVGSQFCEAFTASVVLLITTFVFLGALSLSNVMCRNYYSNRTLSIIPKLCNMFIDIMIR